LEQKKSLQKIAPSTHSASIKRMSLVVRLLLLTLLPVCIFAKQTKYLSCVDRGCGSGDKDGENVVIDVTMLCGLTQYTTVGVCLDKSDDDIHFPEDVQSCTWNAAKNEYEYSCMCEKVVCDKAAANDIGIILGVVAGIILLCVVACYCCCCRNKGNNTTIIQGDNKSPLLLNQQEEVYVVTAVPVTNDV
jgi:hypothetical protein